jgi:transposase
MTPNPTATGETPPQAKRTVKRWTGDNRKRAIAHAKHLYLDEHLSIRAVAAKLHVGYGTATRFLIEGKVTRRKRGGSRGRKRSASGRSATP